MALSYVSGTSEKPLLYRTVGEVLADAAAAFPERDAIVVHHQDVRWSFAEFERRVDARPAQPPLDQRVEAESREVALVEHEWMPQRNGPRVIRLVGHEIEQRLRSRAITRVPVDQLLSIQR